MHNRYAGLIVRTYIPRKVIYGRGILRIQISVVDFSLHENSIGGHLHGDIDPAQG